TLTVGSDNTSTTFAGNILGGAMVRNGSGVLTLAGLGNTANLKSVGTGAIAVSDMATNGVGALGTGTVTLQGTLGSGGGLLYTGQNATSAKNLTLASPSTIQVKNAGVNLTLNGLISESTPGQTLIMTGTFNGATSSTLTLMNVANSYTGATEVYGN